MTVEILMATYNGASFVEEQIKSILEQTYPDWHLTVNDDCSTDNTYEILKEYQKKYPHKISVGQSNKNSKNAKNNFFYMLHNTTADYIMFSDQDDYWLPDKIKLTLEAMKLNEENNMPVLVHTDLSVVDKELNIIAKSMFKQQKLDYKKNKPNNLAVQNIVTGCTVMINKPLAQLLYHTPMSVKVHDWWIGLVAGVFGKIVFVNKPTVFYRQHGLNVCGAKNMSDMAYLLKRGADGKNARYMLKQGYEMSKELALVYKEKIQPQIYEMLAAYGNMSDYGKLKRLRVVFKYKLWKNGIVRKIGQIIYM